MPKFKTFLKSSFAQVGLGLTLGLIGCCAVLWLCFLGFVGIGTAFPMYSLHPNLRTVKELPAPDRLHKAIVAREDERVYVSMCRLDKPQNYGLGNVISQKSNWIDAEWINANCLRIYCKRSPEPSFSVKTFGGHHHLVQIDLVTIE